MKTVFLLLCLVVLSACGSDRAARDKARREEAERAARENEAAQKAITDMNRRMFGHRPPPKPTEPAPK